MFVTMSLCLIQHLPKCPTHGVYINLETQATPVLFVTCTPGDAISKYVAHEAIVIASSGAQLRKLFPLHIYILQWPTLEAKIRCETAVSPFTSAYSLQTLLAAATVRSFGEGVIITSSVYGTVSTNEVSWVPEGSLTGDLWGRFWVSGESLEALNTSTKVTAKPLTF